MAQINNTIIPKGVLPLVFILVAFTLLVVTIGVMMPAEAKRSPLEGAARSAELRFADMADGGIAVTSAAGVTVLPPDTNGFVRGALRAMARERKTHAVGPADPFVLVYHEKGRLQLVDPVVGTVIDLRAFGADNAASFVALMPPGDVTRLPSETAAVAGTTVRE